MDGDLRKIQINGIDILTYDDNGDSVPDIEGFQVLPASVPNYDGSAPISATNNPVPMPVQWPYLLKDGTLTAPDAPGGGCGARHDGHVEEHDRSMRKIPTAVNPIVGRVAFWTDDETRKLNINTAGEGSYYAMPHANTNIDMQVPPPASYATAPPLTRE